VSAHRLDPAAQTGSQLLIGHVMHRRLRPVMHRFVYPVFYLRLNLASMQHEQNRWFGVNRWRALSFFEKDYGPRDGTPLLPWIRQHLAEQQIVADGPIVLQTMPRILGYAFNPVSFWYCHDSLGTLQAILVEVNNTFGEHIHYLLRPGPAGTLLETPLQSGKAMHVSPFCQVKGQYQFQFRNRGALSQVKIDYVDDAQQGVLLHTAITGQCQPLTARNSLAALLHQPLLTLGVVWRIHWQALLLWRKRVPFFRHGSPEAAPLSGT
jgi:DUF1365 family protein